MGFDLRIWPLRRLLWALSLPWWTAIARNELTKDGGVFSADFALRRCLVSGWIPLCYFAPLGRVNLFSDSLLLTAVIGDEPFAYSAPSLQKRHAHRRT